MPGARGRRLWRHINPLLDNSFGQPGRGAAGRVREAIAASRRTRSNNGFNIIMSMMDGVST
eukprot:4066507-Pyramimonas_sp.AAC.1